MNNSKIFVFADMNNIKHMEYSIISNKKVIKTDFCKFADLYKITADNNLTSIRFSLFSELSYFETGRLTVHNKKFIAVVAKKFVDERSVFAEPYVLRYKIIEEENDKFVTALSAMPQTDINEIFSFAYNNSLIVEAVTSVERTIADITKYITDKPTTAIWVKNGVQLMLDVNDGRITSRKVAKYDEGEFIDAAFLGGGSIFFGELADKNNNINLDKLRKLGFNAEEALKCPEIYGLFFNDKNFNFLDNDYTYKVNSYKFSKLAFLIAVVLSFVLILASADKFLHFEQVHKQFIKKRDMLISKEEDIKNKIPDQKEINTLFAVSKLKEKINQELNLGNFLTWLTNIVPPNAIISNINIIPESAATQAQDTRNIDMKEKAQKVYTGKFIVKINLSIRGNYKISEQKALAFIKNVSKKSEPHGNTFVYTKKNNKAQLSAVLIVNGRDF